MALTVLTADGGDASSELLINRAETIEIYDVGRWE